jgi:hypothetical protein
MIYLDSTCLLAVAYDPGTRLLSLWFRRGGGPYTFYGVPGHIYRGLLAATDSHGRYYHARIKGRYGSPGHSPDVYTRAHPDFIRSNPT